MSKLFHLSDPHLSFVPSVTGVEPSAKYGITQNGSRILLQVQKAMDQRTWSKGTNNYTGYLAKIEEFAMEHVTNDDIVVITGDLTHDMPKSKVIWSLMWLDQTIPGTKVLIRGNHDWGVDFGDVRRQNKLHSTILIEEYSFQCVGPYVFGAYSNHKGASGEDGDSGQQKHYCNRELELLEFARTLVKMGARYKKVPVLLSHYPVPKHVAAWLGQNGIKAYMSGHVHCTNNASLPDQADWRWYNVSAIDTDDQLISGCFFSTGTTDVLLNKHGKIMKEIDLSSAALAKGPKPHESLPKLVEKSPCIQILVGLPGSGKSTYAQKLESEGFVRINQDTLGTRDACYKVAARALATGQKVVIDRTNIDARQRETWVKLARHYKVQCIEAVLFDVSLDECIKRVLDRKDHPTINDQVPNERKENIVRRFASSLQLPEVKEGFHKITKV